MLPLFVSGEVLVALYRVVFLGNIEDKFDLFVVHLTFFYFYTSKLRYFVHDGQIRVSNVDIFSFGL